MTDQKRMPEQIEPKLSPKAKGAVAGLILVILLAIVLLSAIVYAFYLSRSFADGLRNIATEIVLIQGILGAGWLAIRLYDVTFEKVLAWLGMKKAFIEFLWGRARKRRLQNEAAESQCQNK